MARRRDPGIIDGKPGTTWQNDTGRTAYQFVASLINTCGFCLQYHRKISLTLWPIPLHPHCRCINVEIPAGEKAPGRFLDHRKLYTRLKADQRVVAVGSANSKLIRAELVNVDDVVIPERVRTLAEVVKAKRLSIKAMVKAGVPTATAKRAYAEARQPEKLLAEQARRKLIFDLEPAIQSQESLADALAKFLQPAAKLRPKVVDIGRNYAEKLKRALDAHTRRTRAAMGPERNR